MEYYLKVYLDENTKKLVYEIVEFDETKQKTLDFYYENMGCDLIDIISSDSGIEFIVDDEGFLVDKNPIFAAKLKSEEQHHTIAGTFMVGIFNGIDNTVGFSSVESLNHHLSKQLQLGFAGLNEE